MDPPESTSLWPISVRRRAGDARMKYLTGSSWDSTVGEVTVRNTLPTLGVS